MWLELGPHSLENVDVLRIGVSWRLYVKFVTLCPHWLVESRILMMNISQLKSPTRIGNDIEWVLRICLFFCWISWIICMYFRVLAYISGFVL